ncbi:MAG: hypothetical protein HAW60_00470 [Bdellovibrionales bacterium]|nr:hypothetical protein [Bdellovibrionales bacterium]
MKFSFVGKIPSSKSLLNRALILKSFNNNLLIQGLSSCDDVLLMKTALKDFLKGKTEFCCGSAGTVLRFLALRLSKKPGKYYLKASQQLLSRPNDELIKLLSQLSCKASFDKNGLNIISNGWSLMGDSVSISAKQSSQFISAFLLSAWNLNFPCYISLGDNIFSESYLQMTMQLCKDQGMKIEYNKQKPYEIYIPKNQKLNAKQIIIEPDMGSVFALSAIACVTGCIQVTDFTINSIQGDVSFINYLQKIGADIDIKILDKTTSILKVKESQAFKTNFSGHLFVNQTKKGFSASLKNTPDLFPSLATLACLLTGESVFTDISHIAHKESNRLLEIKKLLNLLGRGVELKKDSFIIKEWEYVGASPALKQNIIFDTKEDHRLVMAAYVLIAAGFNIKCSDESSVSKSFPEFLALTKNLKN